MESRLGSLGVEKGLGKRACPSSFPWCFLSRWLFLIRLLFLPLGPQRLTPPSEPTPACPALRWGARWRAAAAATAVAVVQLLQVAQLRRSGLQQIHQELASGLLRPLGGRVRPKGLVIQVGKLGRLPVSIVRPVLTCLLTRLMRWHQSQSARGSKGCMWLALRQERVGPFPWLPKLARATRNTHRYPKKTRNPFQISGLLIF